MGEAVETSLGTPQLDSSGSATIASQIPATTRDQVIVGLGKVGQSISQDLQAKNIQPTVTVDSGTGVGILLMSDLRIEQPAAAPGSQPLRAAAPLAPGEEAKTQPVNGGNPTTGAPATGAPTTGTTTGTTTTTTTGTTTGAATGTTAAGGNSLTSQSLTSGLGKPFTGL